ncbi:tyrosine-type recombinase/integrase, partial [Vineibacter terrae]|uniref:tyrosine-type recombinase/integrase n=1 Tax=Vineibacter terrae TaxID=2586908 RepID=UPI002E324CB7
RIESPLSKTDDIIWLPISRALMVELANLDECRRGKLFPWNDRHEVYDWLVPLRERLGVDYTPHQSRHAMATDMQRRQIPDKQAAANGAWADPRSLQRYQHVIPEPIPGRTVGALIPKRKRAKAAAGNGE